MADAGDHRRVVQFVRQDDAVGHQLRDRRNGGVVGHVAGGEQQSRLLAVQVGQFLFQLGVQVGRARDVAGAAGADAHARPCFGKSGQHVLVLGLAKIIVGTPHDDVRGRTVGMMACRVGEVPGMPLQMGEHAVAALTLHLVDGVLEYLFIVHRVFSCAPPSRRAIAIPPGMSPNSRIFRRMRGNRP